LSWMFWRREKSLVADRNWTLAHPAHCLFTVIATPSSSTHMLSRHLIPLYSLFEVGVSLLWFGGHWLVIFSVSGAYVKGVISRFRKITWSLGSNYSHCHMQCLWNAIWPTGLVELA
jgi:hypothetical protein